MLDNVDFLAAGYYIGREVGHLSSAEDESDQRQAAGLPESDTQATPLDADAAS